MKKKPYVTARTPEELSKILGLSPLEHYQSEMHVKLLMAIADLVHKNKWTHAQAAKKARVGRTVITGIVNFNVQSISLDRLIDIATRLGLDIEIKVA